MTGSGRPAAGGWSRRRLLGVLGAGALGAGLAGCGSSASGPAPASGHEPTDDLEVLNGGLEVEHQAIAAYSAMLAHLTGPSATFARRIREQERAHVDALTAVVREFGWTPESAPAAAPTRRVRTSSAALALLCDVENRAIAYYVDALPKITSPLRHVLAGIVANEAEHLAVLRLQRGTRAAPDALVWGHR